MPTYLIIAQIVVSILVVITIALQQRGTALGSAFGGGGESYTGRRGLQKNLFYLTIVLTAIFIVLGIIGLIL